MIYVITSGYYADYSIEYVFSDKELAQKFVDLNPYCKIEEFESDKFSVQLQANLKYYWIDIRETGIVTRIHQVIYSDEIITIMKGSYGTEFIKPGELYLHLEIFAKDEQDAIRIANEKREQILAEGLWKDGYKEFLKGENNEH